MRYSFFTGSDAEKCSVWVGTRIPGCEEGWSNCVVLLCHDDEIKGGVVFHDYNPSAGVICLSAAGSPRGFTREMIRRTHEYVFSFCQMVMLQVREDNDGMNRIVSRLGYVPHRIPRLSGREAAAILWTLTDDDWRQSKFKR